MMRLVYPMLQGKWANAFSLPIYTFTFHPALSATRRLSLPFFIAGLLLPQLLQGQCYTLICNQNVPLALGTTCEGTVNNQVIIQNNWQCAGPTVIKYYTQSGAYIGTSVNGNYLGQTLNVNVKHTWSGNSCWGSVIVVDNKKPVITTQNVSLNCTQDAGATALGYPWVTDNCSGSNVTLSYQDTVLDWSCGYTGFAGYFAPPNWDLCLPNTGDGGVDVTGAPDEILVEGANNSPLNLNPRYITRYKITIPTDGFVSFDWNSVGGSSFNTDAFYLTINNWCVQLSNDSIQNGSYTTGLLKPGDVLSFEQTSDGNADAVNTLISNFHFHTAAWKIINRQWTATDASGNVATKIQTITIRRAALSQVHFPPNRDGIQAPMLNCGGVADLAITGEPFIDDDGNLATTADQFPIQNGDCTFNLAYTDQAVPTCGGSGLVLRKWTVIEDCTGQLVEHTQLIKLFDTTPPVIACPANFTVSTANFGCFGEITLPAATAADDCSSAIAITPFWSFGSGFGPFGNVAPGTYPISYTATDACNNSSNCATQITVTDQIAPTVVCDNVTVASLNADGTALVNAMSVDDGTYDWCCISSYLVKRQGAPDNTYSPTLFIECADLNGSANVGVRLKVTDCAGNSNFCDVTVQIEDQFPPIISVPADVTVDCSTDLGNLTLFGAATVTDNCTFNLQSSDSQTFTNCGQGMVTRTWTATDQSGNTASAQQLIHLINQTPWNQSGNQITWPLDYSTSGCGVSIDPFDLPAPFNGPSFTGQNGCELVGVAYDDEFFWTSEPACYKVLRHWKIADDCQYVPNSGSNTGYWEHTQTIEVFDNEAPVFINPPTTVAASMTGNDCVASVVLPMPSVNDCSNHVTISASGQLGSGFSFQNVPVGSYLMTYHASDGCGNTSNHTVTVLVADTKAPTASCLSGFSTSLDASGQVTLSAHSFNLNSSDNCTPASSLVFCYSSNPSDVTYTFNCTNLGQQPVQLYVMDQAGNMGSCQTYLMLLDNGGACAQGGLSISGKIQTPGNEAVGNVSVNLAGFSIAPAMTPAGGTFQFANLPSGLDYTLTPSKNMNSGNGVTAFDLARINDHILAVTPFTHAWQIIAADANGNGNVTVSDVVAIQNVILFNTPNFPNGVTSWRFVPASHVFANPANPYPFPETISLTDLTVSNPNADFIAIKIGDVTGNANPALLGGTSGSSSTVMTEVSDRSGDLFVLETEDRLLQAGVPTDVLFQTSDAAAWQWTLAFDPQLLKFQEFVKNNDDSYEHPVFGETHLDEGILTALWAGKKAAPAFTLRFLPKINMRLSEALRLSPDDYTPAAAWSRSEERMEVQLNFFKAPTHDSRITISPNPFSQQTTLSFHLETAGEARFQFFDASGKLLFTVSKDFEVGANQLIVSRKDLPVMGLVYFRMESGSEVAVGKLVAH